jgi:tripartite-type tricarboxylate transporter receptor subunit TctC
MQWLKRKNLAVALAATTLFAVSGFAAWPQTGPTIKLILPFPPGGPADTMARLVAQQIGATGRPTMVVESHPGAATEIGTELVAMPPPTATPWALSRLRWSCCRIFASSTTTRSKTLGDFGAAQH